MAANQRMDVGALANTIILLLRKYQWVRYTAVDMQRSLAVQGVTRDVKRVQKALKYMITQFGDVARLHRSTDRRPYTYWAS